MINTTQDHCCEDMEYYATTNLKEHEFVRYHGELRNYNFLLHGTHKGFEVKMRYCPWCGTKLPSSLGEEWCKVIKENFGLDEVLAKQWAKLPEEYKTDQWWKKRGL